MSHANGIVYFEDGTIMYYEYDGTTDSAIPKLYKTYNDMSDNWRKWDYQEPSCDHNPEPVEIFTDHGKGFYWKGTACRKCNMIIEGRSLEDIEEIEGIPEFVPKEYRLRLYD